MDTTPYIPARRTQDGRFPILTLHSSLAGYESRALAEVLWADDAQLAAVIRTYQDADDSLDGGADVDAAICLNRADAEALAAFLAEQLGKRLVDAD